MRHLIRFGYAVLALGIATSACTSEVSPTAVDDAELQRRPTTRSPKAPLAAPLAEDAGASTDAAPAPKPPEPVPPSEVADGGAPQDASVGPCVTDGDCTTYSSYCASDPCECFGQRLGTTMTCSGRTVGCFRDPCLGKVAVCVAGQCVL